MTSSSEHRHKGVLPFAGGVPQLRGVVLVLFRLLWAAALMAALVAITVGGWNSYRSYAQFERPISELGLRPGWLSEEARQGRFVRGSQIIAVDGRPVSPADRRSFSEALRGPEGATVQLQFRAPDGSRRDIRLTRSAERLRGQSAAIGISPGAAAIVRLAATALASLLMLSAAILLFWRRARDPVAALLSFSMLCIVAGDTWGYTLFAGLGLTWLADLFNGLGYPLLPLVLLVFPDGRFEPRWTRWVALLNLAWAALSYLQLSYRELNNVILVGLLLTGVAALGIRLRKLPPGPQRLQIKWAMLGFAAGTLFLLIYVLLDTLRKQTASDAMFAWANVAAPVAISLYLLAFAGGLLVSIFRYRLYDAETAISRSATYAALTLMLAGTFAASAKGVELLFESTFGSEAGVVAGIAGAGIAVMLITPLSSRVQQWAERRFQKRLLRLRRDLPAVLDDLKVSASPAQLLAEVVSRVGHGVGTVRVAIVGSGEAAVSLGVEPGEVDKWRAAEDLSGADLLQCRSGDPLFPLRVALRGEEDAEAAGWLLLGPRPDGTLPGGDERLALSEIAEPIGRAIRITTSRADQEAARERRLAALETKLARLQRKAAPADLPRDA